MRSSMVEMIGGLPMSPIPRERAIRAQVSWRRWSWRRWSRAREQIARPGDDFGRQLVLGREFGQQPFVAGEVVEHAEQEVRLARGVAQRLRLQSGDGEEAAEPFRVLRDEAKGLNRQHFGRF